MKEGQGWPLCSGPAARGRRAPTAVGKPVGGAGSEGQTRSSGRHVLQAGCPAAVHVQTDRAAGVQDSGEKPR